MIRNILVIALVFALAAPIAACGRKSAPQAPPREQIHILTGFYRF